MGVSFNPNPYSDGSGQPASPWQSGGNPIANLLRTAGAAMQTYGNVAMSPQQRQAREALEASMAIRRAQLESLAAYRQAMTGLGQQRADTQAQNVGSEVAHRAQQEMLAQINAALKARGLQLSAAGKGFQIGEIPGMGQAAGANPTVAPAPTINTQPSPSLSGIMSGLFGGTGISPLPTSQMSAQQQANLSKTQAGTESEKAGTTEKQAQTAVAQERLKEMPDLLKMRGKALNIEAQRLGLSVDNFQRMQAIAAAQYGPDQLTSLAKNNPLAAAMLGQIQYDPNTGQMIAQKSPLAATAQTRNMQQMASGLLPMFDKAINRAQKLSDKLGPLNGRWNEFMAGKIGSGDPDFSALRDTVALLSSGALKAHFGSRGGQQMYEHFVDMANTGKMNVPTLVASLKAMREFMQHYSNMVQTQGNASMPRPVNAASGAGTASKIIDWNQLK